MIYRSAIGPQAIDIYEFFINIQVGITIAFTIPTPLPVPQVALNVVHSPTRSTAHCSLRFNFKIRFWPPVKINPN
jgi:hypothetical protein